MEPAVLRTLPALHLQRLHPIFSELDCSLRFRHLLSGGAATASRGLHQVRAAGARDGRGIPDFGHPAMERGRAPLLFDRLLTAELQHALMVNLPAVSARMRPTNMDFDQLNTFVEVAKHGSFSLAGRKVFRSQSAVSAQIRQLEQEYGEKLFGRLGKSVRLTPAGEVLFEYAGRLLALRQESLRGVADQSATPRGIVTIGANEATCLYVLPDVFGKYQRLDPGVQISIYRNFSHKILQRVEDGTIDLGIVTLPVKSPSLKVHSIYRDRVMLMVSRKNPLAKQSTVTAKDIAG